MTRRKIIKKFCFFTILASGIFIGVYSRGQKIQAKPDNGNDIPIVVDKGSNEEYRIPFDATQLWEPKLLSDSEYNNFVQSKEQGNIIEKIKLSTYFEEGDLAWDVGSNTILQLSNGNFVAIILKTAPNSAVQSQQVLLYIDKEGEILDTYLGDYSPTSVGVRFQTFMDVPVYKDSEGNESFVISGKNASRNTALFEGKIQNDKLKVAELKEFPGFGAYNINTEGIVNEGKKQYPNKIVRANAGLVEETVTSNKFVVNYENGDLLDSSEVTLTNPGFNFDMRGNEQWIGLQEMVKNPNGSILGVTTSSVTTLPNSQGAKYAYGLSLFDANFKNQKNIYLSGIVDVNFKATLVKDLAIGNNQYVFLSSSDKDSVLLEIDTEKETVSIVKQFPAKTSLLFSRATNNSYISYVGYIDSTWDELKGYPIKNNSLISGTMNPSDFSIRTITGSQISGAINISKMIPLGTYQGQEYFAISGLSTDPLDKMYPKQLENTTLNKHFFGTLYTKDDYAPAIEKLDSIQLNIEEINGSNKDQLLLKGNNNNQSIKVFDMKDSNEEEIEGMLGQNWLDNRINRNPNAIKNPIDWGELGFEDNGKVGINRVTYFVTDSQKQTTTTSRIVNKIDNSTVSNKKGALAAYNFWIDLKDVDKLTDQSLRDTTNYANLKAWDMFDETIDNILTLPESEGVKIDTNQLNKIRSATESGIFDLTFYLNYGDEMKQKTIKVFVGGEQVEDYVFYSSNFRIPWDLSRDITSEQLLNGDYGNVSAYKISEGIKMDKLKIKDGAVTDFTKIDPVSGEVTQLLPTQIIEPETNKVLAESTLGPKGTVYYRYEDVTVHFVDEAYQVLYDENDENFPASTTLDKRIVGKQLNLADEADIKTEKAMTEQSKGYEFLNYYQADKKTVYPIDGLEVPYMEGKGWTAYLQFKGILRFIKVPETMSFENGKVSAKDQKLEASSANESLFIGDNRTNQDKDRGWRLYAKINQEFISSDNDSLPNILYYHDQLIAKSNVEIKMNNSVTKTEVKLTKESGLNLKIPGGTAKKKTYGASITWELTAAL